MYFEFVRDNQEKEINIGNSHSCMEWSTKQIEFQVNIFEFGSLAYLTVWHFVNVNISYKNPGLFIMYSIRIKNHPID